MIDIAFKEYNEILGSIKNSYHEAAVRLNLPDSELDILYVLAAYPEGCRQSTLYRESGHTKSTVNSAIKKMEKNGYLNVVSAEGRNTHVSVTKKGQELMKKTAYPVIELENEIFRSWSDQEQEMFVRLNREYAAGLREKIDRWKA